MERELQDALRVLRAELEARTGGPDLDGLYRLQHAIWAIEDVLAEVTRRAGTTTRTTPADS